MSVLGRIITASKLAALLG